MRGWIAVLALAACGDRTEAKPQAAAPACEALPFAKSLPIAEASGAALIAEGLIVVADSGNHGAYVIVDPANGDLREQGALPLPEGVSDDVEGLSSPDGTTITGLTSTGVLLRWSRAADGKGFTLDAHAPVSDRRDDNFEGLCLAPHAAKGACDGFAASKADGHLYCLRGGTIDRATSFAITRPDSLADCGFSPDGKALVAGGNVFTADMVWRVDPATGAKTELGPLGPGNAEVVVVADGGVVYRLSDLNTSPSLAGKFRCPALAR